MTVTPSAWIVPPVRFQAPDRTYTIAALLLELSMQGVGTRGGRHVAERPLEGFAVLNDSVPPVIDSGPSNTTLPPLKVTLVPLPMLKPPGQSTHQYPDTVIVPEGLHL